MRDGRTLISARDSRSFVWRLGDIVIKEAPKVQIDTELYFLQRLADSGYVPAPATRLGVERLKMPFIENERVTDPTAFLSHFEGVMNALKDAGCRHGDLTEYAVLVSGNKPVIIDFAEARYLWSPLPSKRPEGDRHWLLQTMQKLAGKYSGQV